MDSASERADHPFVRFGEGSSLQPPGFVHGAEAIAIGDRVVVYAGYRWIAATDAPASRPIIVIGDGVQADAGLHITASGYVELKRDVWCGPRVTIADSATEHRRTGLPVSRQQTADGVGRVIVGEGAYLGANCVVEGSVVIGTGSVVEPGSVVRADVPDYCVVRGVPARIVEMFDTDAMDWIPVESEAEAERVLRRRTERPLLTVCIPTFNRSRELVRCLDSVLSQTSADGLVDVCVSDNASDDDTPAVLARYAMRYPQLRVFRQPVNIGGERNYLEIVKLARGAYVKLHGDDDFFRPGTLHPIVYAIARHRCKLTFIDVLRGDGTAAVLEGMDVFLKELSLAAGFITSIVAEREALLAVAEPEKFVGTSLNHVYWLYELLREHPRFCLIKSSIFEYAFHPPRGYNYGDAAIRGYLSILGHFVGQGLSPEAFAAEKKTLLDKFVLPRLELLIGTGLPFDYAGFEDIFTAHYRDEPYYDDYLAEVRRILAKAQDGRDVGGGFGPAGNRLHPQE